MGFREAVLLGFVLLLSGENPCAATQNWSNMSTIETPTRIPQEHGTTSLQPAGDPGSNWTEHGAPLRSPVTYRLKVHQLRTPEAVTTTTPTPSTTTPPIEEQTHTSQSPQWWEADVLTSEQLEPEVTVLEPRSLKPTEESFILQGPDLDPPGEPDSVVQTLMIEERVPVPADTVVAHCGEGEVTVEVKRNFLGNGQLIRPIDLTLGGCPALDSPHHILRFQSELQDCSCTFRITEEALIYSFLLIYTPTPIGNTFILKTNPAKVVIECHYPRRLLVSSSAVRPTWKPFLSSMLSEQRLQFTLRLMTEDWQSPRPSNSYRLGEVMHIEAVALRGHHVPLRVYVDSCVATVGADPGSLPRYPFVSNHGCLSDAKLTGAKSYFMQRSQEDTLNFQLRAFRFNHEHKHSLYITCRLKATKVSAPIDSQNKACSFLPEANRWVASGGDNKVCGCCETSCSKGRKKRGLEADVDAQWEGTVAVGPILLEESPILLEESFLLEENILLEELTAQSELQTHQVAQAASSPSTALLCGGGVALATVLLVVMGAIIRSRSHKLTEHSVGT
ncbi:zona pellucida sperm-binding protein 3-like [Cyclopterus lumpus]|uniref:zona pellucida sperm-binding protein 3-like n=1 Tax=Cyclopterus lumpus TaxID=8103 RepID=UPI0014860206|nr:zona pellucida sperm-binding protein 3-like [Cyclopterus lumpus]